MRGCTSIPKNQNQNQNKKTKNEKIPWELRLKKNIFTRNTDTSYSAHNRRIPFNLPVLSPDVLSALLVAALRRTILEELW